MDNKKLTWAYINSAGEDKPVVHISLKVLANEGIIPKEVEDKKEKKEKVYTKV